VFREAEIRGEEPHIMIGGGITVHNAFLTMPNRRYQKFELYASAAIGRAPNDDPIVNKISTSPEMNMYTAWLRLGHALSHLHFVTMTPPEVSSNENFEDEERQSHARQLLAEHVRDISQRIHFKNLLTKMYQAQIAVIGFGGLEDSPEWPGEPTQSVTVPLLLKSYGINPAFLIKEGAVGEFGYSLIDENGETRKEWQLFLTAGYPNGPDFFRKMAQVPGNRVIGIGNLYSYQTIEAALKGKLINVLITDQLTARKLLKVPN
jgi:hypothetical protein